MTGPAAGTVGYKYAQITAAVRAQITSGTLHPGGSAPSGAALARRHRCAVPTARKALRTFTQDGTLIPGPTPNSRLRIASPDTDTASTPGLARARAELSAALAARRRAAALTQPELAARAGCSLTSIGHADAGRLWQSRRFWNKLEKYSTPTGRCSPCTIITALPPTHPPPASPARLRTPPRTSRPRPGPRWTASCSSGPTVRLPPSARRYRAPGTGDSELFREQIRSDQP